MRKTCSYFMRGLLCSLPIWLGLPAHAVVTYDGAGHIQAVTEVAVTASTWGGSSGAPVTRYFDVSFAFGTYAEVFGSSTGLPAGWRFDTMTLASAATLGVSSELNAAGVDGSTPFVGGEEYAWTPFNVGDIVSSGGTCFSCVQARGVWYWDLVGTWKDPGTTPAIAQDAARTWAQYTEVTPSVPEPHVYMMLCAGLGLLSGVARRRKHTTACAPSGSLQTQDIA
jgi:hypothetical protein